MIHADFRNQVLSRQPIVGTFLKTPSHDVIEVLARSGLDTLIIDTEHAPFDRSRTDACLAVARALDFPLLVRVGDSTPREILQALDMGAAGVVVPHVDSVEKARAAAKAARFGLGGRGYAGSTRWAGFATRPMAEVLTQSQSETVVFAQIEEPAGVEAAAEIAAVEGIDGLFLGPADLTVAYGHDGPGAPEVSAAMASVGQAAAAAGKAYATFCRDGSEIEGLRAHGFNGFFVASEHAWMLSGARACVAALQDAIG